MTGIELLTFSMRTEAPKAGADWFRIVEAKKASEATKIYIYDEIGFWGTSAKDFVAQLDDIDASEIELHLNSPGGSVFDGLAIHASLKNHKAKVIGIVDGLAASAASFILQAADVRKSTRNAQIMIHDAKAYAGGNAQQMRNAADTLDRISDNIADIYAVRSGQTKSAKEFRDLMKAGDKWYNGNEALDDGLVDEVMDNPDEDEDAENLMANTWSTEEIENFLKASPEALTAAQHVSTTNRVEEAQMTGAADPSKQTPPPVAQPPAPVAQVAPVNFPEALTRFTTVRNDQTVLDMDAVVNHIEALETFKKETIEGSRKSFVAGLASGASPKILATEVENMEEFAISLSDEQFAKWKASMEAAPSNSLLQKHGVGPEDKHAPLNGTTSSAQAATADRISILQGIVLSHKQAGVSQEDIEKKGSYKELQNLLAASSN
jgi:ATP-dependent Clp endopeptidase proteolytic subunit ClpP